MDQQKYRNCSVLLTYSRHYQLAAEIVQGLGIMSLPERNTEEYHNAVQKLDAELVPAYEHIHRAGAFTFRNLDSDLFQMLQTEVEKANQGLIDKLLLEIAEPVTKKSE